MPQYLTKADLLRAVPISLATLNRHISRGEIRVVRFGRRVLIDPMDALAWIERRKTSAK